MVKVVIIGPGLVTTESGPNKVFRGVARKTTVMRGEPR